MRLFANRRFAGVVVTNTLTMLGPSALLFFLSQYFQLVQGYTPLQAGVAELPAAVAAMVFGVAAGVVVRYWSQRAVLATALTVLGAAMASLTAISPSTGYPHIGIALFVIGAGLGVAFAVANDVIIASVPPQNAGAAAGISETAYELGTALGIALLGTVIASVHREFGASPGSFASGIGAAAGIGAVLVLASAIAVWILLKTPPAQQLLPYRCDESKEGAPR